MLKIMHYITNLRKGGAERIVIDIVRGLSKKKDVNVKLILLQNKIEYDIEDIRHLIHIIPATIKFSITSKKVIDVKELQNFIDEFQPDIIHTHLFEAELFCRFCTYPKAKWFSHCHDNMEQFRNFDLETLLSKKKLQNYYEKLFLFHLYKKNGGTRFIAISIDTENYFKKTANKYPITKLPNAIKYDKFSNQNHERINNRLSKLICVASLEDKKNHVFLIDVMALLKKKGINVTLDMFGEGDSRPIIEKKIVELGLENEITLKGIVNNVEDFLKTADIYVHSAYSEAFGLSMMEAMASGLPVICLDGGGNRDIIEQGINGYMIHENTVEAFADKIILLLNDPDLYRKMSKNASEFAKKYDITMYVENLLALYNKL